MYNMRKPLSDAHHGSLQALPGCKDTAIRIAETPLFVASTGDLTPPQKDIAPLGAILLYGGIRQQRTAKMDRILLLMGKSYDTVWSDADQIVVVAFESFEDCDYFNRLGFEKAKQLAGDNIWDVTKPGPPLDPRTLKPMRYEPLDFSCHDLDADLKMIQRCESYIGDMNDPSNPEVFHDANFYIHHRSSDLQNATRRTNARRTRLGEVTCALHASYPDSGERQQSSSVFSPVVGLRSVAEQWVYRPVTSDHMPLREAFGSVTSSYMAVCSKLSNGPNVSMITQQGSMDALKTLSHQQHSRAADTFRGAKVAAVASPSRFFAPPKPEINALNDFGFQQQRLNLSKQSGRAADIFSHCKKG